MKNKLEEKEKVVEKVEKQKTVESDGKTRKRRMGMQDDRGGKEQMKKEVCGKKM